MLNYLTVVAGLSSWQFQLSFSLRVSADVTGTHLQAGPRGNPVTQLSGLACDKAHTLVVSMLFALCGLPLAVSPAQGTGSPSSLWLRVSGWLCRMLLSHTQL